jgi:beta-glucosidase
VRVTVKNIGSLAGSEVVQLYISDLEATIKRPLKELKGFKKLHLGPGEHKETTFEVDKYAISYYDEDRASWIAEAGRFVVELGTSSSDIRCKANFELSATYWWTGL